LKVLLDENLPHALRKHLAHHETLTAAFAGLSGLRNGNLLKAAEDAGFEVLVTADQTLHYEQNMTGRRLAFVCLSANSWNIIKENLRSIVAAVDAATQGSLVKVECGDFVRQRARSNPKFPEPY
jgi:hypothetical protein